MSIAVSPVMAEGRIVGVTAIVRDLSAHSGPVAPDRECGETVAMPAAFARPRVSSAEASVIIVGTTVVFATAHTLRLAGADDASQLVGHDMFDFVAPASIESTRARQQSACAGVWPRPEQLTLRRIDGSEMQVELASTPVLWEGQPASQVTMWEMTDVGEQLRVLATGLRTEVADAVIVTDANFRIQTLNSAAEELYGWAESELIGQRLATAIPVLGDEADLKVARDRLRDDGRWHGRVAQRRRDGSVVHVLASTTMLTDSSGTSCGAISVNRVTTEPTSTLQVPHSTQRGRADPSRACQRRVRRSLPADRRSRDGCPSVSRHWSAGTIRPAGCSRLASSSMRPSASD